MSGHGWMCVRVGGGWGGGHTPKTTRAASISTMLIKKSSNEANCPPVLPNCWPAYEFVVFVGTLLAAVRAHPLEPERFSGGPLSGRDAALGESLSKPERAPPRADRVVPCSLYSVIER